ncbi:glycosyltransferase [Mesorhizobium sp. C416B]|uniref:glycosyltransferase family 2 protein n=1 Tax=unclassified Mesorhizobium TaxID=325217 RepID=UPI0003CF6CD6|nr:MULTISPECIES: glycosyltransferase family A protein [unclassified Mesorhizobium]ESX50395.1 hypothetical protein X762_07270 [Mesorhizobium sp. LSHC426A00]ESX57832.1 hypothetical protein X761_06175 [Mesorhizobium sp. LSHC424B00]ESX75430.1 hypothetical protein X758_05780 [Mesorhizobium sp. LSHC416B00]WJI63371.1 glycosyltransferase [Mesorhizobium sp. C416B]
MGETEQGGAKQVAQKQVELRSGWRPKVTALVPCYNSAAFILRTLDSLAAQTWDNIEILVGEDNSTDATFEIVSAFAGGRDDVRILRRDKNLGWLKNSNDLMANASGELMFFAFHDDVIDPTYIEALVRALDANPEAVLSFSDVEVIEVRRESATWKFDLLEGLQDGFVRGRVMARQPHGWGPQPWGIQGLGVPPQRGDQAQQPRRIQRRLDLASASVAARRLCPRAASALPQILSGGQHQPALGTQQHPTKGIEGGGDKGGLAQRGRPGTENLPRCLYRLAAVAVAAAIARSGKTGKQAIGAWQPGQLRMAPATCQSGCVKTPCPANDDFRAYPAAPKWHSG